MADKSLHYPVKISISEIINKHENYISIQNIRSKKLNSTSTFEKTNIRQLILELNSRKPMGIDTIPPKIVKMLNDDICDNIKSIANSMITQSLFSDQAKISSMTPVFKKDDRMDEKNYRPISVLCCLSKVLDKWVLILKTFFLHIFQVLESDMHGCQYVLMRMTEKWRTTLDNKKVIVALSMGLSKAFDSLPHDILIAKIHAYGLIGHKL